MKGLRRSTCTISLLKGPGRILNLDNIRVAIFSLGEGTGVFVHFFFISRSRLIPRSRNAALGHGDSKDRLYPDQVVLEHSTELSGPDKFIPIQVKAASMAKLHTSS